VSAAFSIVAISLKIKIRIYIFIKVGVVLVAHLSIWSFTLKPIQLLDVIRAELRVSCAILGKVTKAAGFPARCAPILHMTGLKKQTIFHAFFVI
jgi:hypothetical protein